LFLSKRPAILHSRDEKMIRRKTEMEKEVRERMRDGKGAVEILHVFRRDELHGKARLFARMRLRTGCSIGYHLHDGEEEIFYILSGTGQVTEGSTTTQVGPGDAVLTTSGGGHSIENLGAEPLDFLATILVY
jgi:mannose-6-phosphate isomerase-like protein (cupin superfamily)